MAQSVTGQIVEIWILYVIGASMIAARIFCRTKLVGYRGYQWDDYLIVALACMWTAAPVIGQVFVQGAKGRHTSDLTFNERKNMSESERKEWAYGSQIFLLGLTGYFVILWTLKFNMLCFYSRVVRGLWTEKFVKPLMVMVGLSATAIIFTLALTCRPFNHLWQVWPDPGSQCVPQNIVFFVVMLTFNLLTDLCIMLVPIPVLRGIQINRFQKVGLYFLFSLGFFCMFAAVLRFVLIFNLNHRGVSAMWSLREDCVGIFVGQAPMITPMLKRRFWVNTGYATSKSGSSNNRIREFSHRNPGESYQLRSTAPVSSRRAHDPYSMTTLGIGSESQEEMVRRNLESPAQPELLQKPHNGILVQSRIEIEGLEGDYKNTGDPRW